MARRRLEVSPLQHRAQPGSAWECWVSAWHIETSRLELVLALSLGFGLLFLHFFTAFAAQATSLLFGNVLAVDIATIWILLVLGMTQPVGARCDLAATSVREHSTRVGRSEGREPAALFRLVPGHRWVGDGGVRADRRRFAGLHLDGRAGRGGTTSDDQGRDGRDAVSVPCSRRSVARHFAGVLYRLAVQLLDRRSERISIFCNYNIDEICGCSAPQSLRIEQRQCGLT